MQTPKVEGAFGISMSESLVRSKKAETAYAQPCRAFTREPHGMLAHTQTLPGSIVTAMITYRDHFVISSCESYSFEICIFRRAAQIR